MDNRICRKFPDGGSVSQYRPNEIFRRRRDQFSSSPPPRTRYFQTPGWDLVPTESWAGSVTPVNPYTEAPPLIVSNPTLFLLAPTARRLSSVTYNFTATKGRGIRVQTDGGDFGTNGRDCSQSPEKIYRSWSAKRNSPRSSRQRIRYWWHLLQLDHNTRLSKQLP
jgi:hypothetical protein